MLKTSSWFVPLACVLGACSAGNDGNAEGYSSLSLTVGDEADGAIATDETADDAIPGAGDGNALQAPSSLTACARQPSLNVLFARISGRGERVRDTFVEAQRLSKLRVLCVTNARDYDPRAAQPIAGSLRQQLAVAAEGTDGTFTIIQFDAAAFPDGRVTDIPLESFLEVPSRTFINGVVRPGSTARSPHVGLRGQIVWDAMQLDLSVPGFPQCVYDGVGPKRNHTLLRFAHAQYAGVAGVRFRKLHKSEPPSWYAEYGKELQKDCLDDSVSVLGDSTVAIVENRFDTICGDECISIRDYAKDGVVRANSRVSIGFNDFVGINKAIMALDNTAPAGAYRMLGSIYRNNFIDVQQRSPRLSGQVDFVVNNNFSRNWKFNGLAFSPKVKLRAFDNFYDPGKGANNRAIFEISSNADDASFVGETTKSFSNNFIVSPGGTFRTYTDRSVTERVTLAGTKWLRRDPSAPNGRRYRLCSHPTLDQNCAFTTIDANRFGHDAPIDD